MKKIVYGVMLSSILVFPTVGYFMWTDQLETVLRIPQVSNQKYVIISGETSVVIKVSNQKKTRQKLAYVNQRELFKQLELQLVVLPERPKIDDTHSHTSILGEHLKAMSGTLLLGQVQHVYS